MTVSLISHDQSEHQHQRETLVTYISNLIGPDQYNQCNKIINSKERIYSYLIRYNLTTNILNMKCSKFIKLAGLNSLPGPFWPVGRMFEIPALT